MNVEIANRLAVRRRRAGLSQEALAEKLGVSRQAVSKWERSESSPDTDNLIALAQLYGVSLDELLYADASAEGAAADRAQEGGDVVGVGESESADGEGPGGSSGDAGGGRGGAASCDVTASRDAASAADGAAGRGAANSQERSSQGGVSTDATGVVFEKEGKGHVHVGFDGLHVDDGKDQVHVSWADGVHVIDRKGEEVRVGWDGVRVRTSDAGAAEEVFTRGHRHDRFKWCSHHGKSCEDCDEADSCPDKPSPFARAWLKFPFPVVALLAYLCVGMMWGMWVDGLLWFFAIPVCYMVGAAIASRRLAPLLAGMYSLGVTAWFFWMAFVEGQPHPAWVAFLTIPLVVCLVVKISECWQKRKPATPERI